MQRSRRWIPHFVWATFVIGTVTMILVAIAQEENPNPAEQCEGIGWGCQLYGADRAGFVAILLVPAALVVMVVGHLLIGWFNRKRSEPSHARRRAEDT